MEVGEFASSGSGFWFLVHPRPDERALRANHVGDAAYEVLPANPKASHHHTETCLLLSRYVMRDDTGNRRSGDDVNQTEIRDLRKRVARGASDGVHHE
jgi:hypothetical protein